MKRNYPLFIIDRSKSEAYPFDYIVCLDQTVGFVARVVHFLTDIQYFEFVKVASQVEHSEYFNVTMKFNKGGVILAAEEFLYDFEMNTENKNRIKTLLKKSLKKHLHAEDDRTAFGDCDIDNQILQQQETIERARSNYSDLVQRTNGDTAHADYVIRLAEATLDTLKKFRDNQKYFYQVMN